MSLILWLSDPMRLTPAESGDKASQFHNKTVP